jgi:hypothetical protein
LENSNQGSLESPAGSSLTYWLRHATIPEVMTYKQRTERRAAKLALMTGQAISEIESFARKFRVKSEAARREGAPTNDQPLGGRCWAFDEAALVFEDQILGLKRPQLSGRYDSPKLKDALSITSYVLSERVHWLRTESKGALKRAADLDFDSRRYAQPADVKATQDYLRGWSEAMAEAARACVARIRVLQNRVARRPDAGHDEQPIAPCTMDRGS